MSHLILTQREFPTRTVTGKTFTASGPGGHAIQSIADQVSDYSIKTVGRLAVKVSADDIKGTGDLDLLVMALGMLPKHSINVTATLSPSSLTSMAASSSAALRRVPTSRPPTGTSPGH